MHKYRVDKQRKDKALDLGKKAAGAALDFVEKAAEATLKRTGKAAGKAAGYVKEKAGAVAQRTGEKVREKAAEQDGVLLLLGLVFAGLAAEEPGKAGV